MENCLGKRFLYIEKGRHSLLNLPLGVQAPSHNPQVTETLPQLLRGILTNPQLKNLYEKS